MTSRESTTRQPRRTRASAAEISTVVITRFSTIGMTDDVSELSNPTTLGVGVPGLAKPTFSETIAPSHGWSCASTGFRLARNTGGVDSPLNHASGIVRCGGAIGTAQLTLRADVVTTAAHVLIGPDGKARGGTCTFEPSIGGSRQGARDERVPWAE